LEKVTNKNLQNAKKSFRDWGSHQKYITYFLQQGDEGGLKIIGGKVRVVAKILKFRRGEGIEIEKGTMSVLQQEMGLKEYSSTAISEKKGILEFTRRA